MGVLKMQQQQQRMTTTVLVRAARTIRRSTASTQSKLHTPALEQLQHHHIPSQLQLPVTRSRYASRLARHGRISTLTSTSTSTSTHTRLSGGASPGSSTSAAWWLSSVLAAVATWAYFDQNGVKLLQLDLASADEPPVTSHRELDQTPLHLDPDTSMAFPASLSTPNTSGALELVGLGVRVVSFLRVQVYSVGAYFSPLALNKVKALSGLKGPDNGEILVASLLDMPYDMAIRIVPVKNTDHSHLRDGFVRAMMARLSLASKNGSISSEEAETAGASIETFKGFFPNGKVPKGKSMLLIRRGSDGALLIEYEGKLLGTFENPFLSKQMMLAYFAENGKEISPKMKADVLAGLERYM